MTVYTIVNSQVFSTSGKNNRALPKKADKLRLYHAVFVFPSSSGKAREVAIDATIVNFRASPKAKTRNFFVRHGKTREVSNSFVNKDHTGIIMYFESLRCLVDIDLALNTNI